MKKVTFIDSIQKEISQKLRVAAYCRISTDSDAQLESLETQKSHYEQYITSRDDWTFAGLYYDEGITGTKKEKRPELLRMISDCEAGKIDFIVTKSISRFSRNTTDCLELVRKLLDLNIPIYFEKENLNTGSMESELFLSILSSIAQGESASISENSKWSVQKRFLNGTYKISSPPYGFRWDGQRMEIVPEQAEIVKWIFAQVLSGKGTQAIADELNDIRIPSKKGGQWTSTTICGLITNEKYVGDALFQKTYTDSQFNRHHNHGQENMYSMSEHHEPIVSREVFETAGRLLEQHSKEKGISKGDKKYQNRYCFSGKIICGECGNTFKRRTHQGYIAWCCKTHIKDKNRCPIKFIRDDELKAAFVTMINKLIFAHELILKPYAAAAGGTDKNTGLHRIKELQTLLLQNTEHKETLTKLMAQGYIDQALFNEEKNRLISQAKQYHAEIKALQRAVSGKVTFADEALFLLHFTEKSAMLYEFDEELFEKTISRISVYSRHEIAFELKCGLILKERI